MPEPPVARSLGEYVGELVARLDAADPAAGARLREVVGRRRARIRLDRETVDVGFDARGTLRAGRPRGAVAGEGATDRGTVLDLLDGRVEVADAILDGRLEVTGEADHVARIFVAIEILLDGSARIPPLQQLARDFRADPGRGPRPSPVGRSRGRAWQPTGDDPAELALLERLGLLP